MKRMFFFIGTLLILLPLSSCGGSGMSVPSVEMPAPITGRATGDIQISAPDPFDRVTISGDENAVPPLSVVAVYSEAGSDLIPEDEYEAYAYGIDAGALPIICFEQGYACTVADEGGAFSIVVSATTGDLLVVMIVDATSGEEVFDRMEGAVPEEGEEPHRIQAIPAEEVEASTLLTAEERLQLQASEGLDLIVDLQAEIEELKAEIRGLREEWKLYREAWKEERHALLAAAASRDERRAIKEEFRREKQEQKTIFLEEKQALQAELRAKKQEIREERTHVREYQKELRRLERERRRAERERLREERRRQREERRRRRQEERERRRAEREAQQQEQEDESADENNEEAEDEDT